MSATKRINTGNYNIDTFKNNGNPAGNVIVTTNTVKIFGNLEVTGITANIQAFNTVNPVLQVDANLTTASTPFTGNSGIEVNRGNQANVGLYWSETGTYQKQWWANNGTTSGIVLTSFNTYVNKSTNDPQAAANTVAISGNTPAAGGSGLFVNAGSTSHELITTVSARKYGIIFG